MWPLENIKCLKISLRVNEFSTKIEFNIKRFYLAGGKNS